MSPKIKQIRQITKDIKYHNCFFFALSLYWKYGGYLAFRKCRPVEEGKDMPGWHWFWSPDMKTWVSWKPKERAKNVIHALIHKLWFKGQVIIGD